MVLAAGRGERMRPLTDLCPKPLLRVHGTPLIGWHLAALARAGYRQAVINTDWLGERLERHYGERHGPLQLAWSREGVDFGGALETAGGIARALPLLEDAFWVVAGDVYVPGFRFAPEALQRFAKGPRLAHLYLVRNPPHNPAGDFSITADGLLSNAREGRHTFSTIGLYRKAFFASLPAGNPEGQKVPLAPLLRQAADNGQVSAQLYDGEWTDVGTPERLALLNAA
ncbi:nucleotidyltransferase family protein [Ramlibacter tataouinensis]|uniref:nucleotidyltransferase family protein n=1 Tax=Ramlibacter tataouinensis TaxID=94132 RepID=UPI0022F3C332|nr:nucleotidyltransferase family protein [Ramlibacter tataouinensis]WBY04002.1 nucleotidyltransferase family protein [Ramlibacter tataouinensis]